MEGGCSVGRVSEPALTPQRWAIPAEGRDHSALCLRGPDLQGSLGSDTRHNLRRPRPAPDKELQLRAGERGGRQEPGCPSPRRDADKDARPPRRPGPPQPRAPQRPSGGSVLSAGAAPALVYRLVHPGGAVGGTRGLRAPGSRERRSEQITGGLSCFPLLWWEAAALLTPTPQVPSPSPEPLARTHRAGTPGLARSAGDRR